MIGSSSIGVSALGCGSAIPRKIITLTSVSTTATAQTLNPHFFSGGESVKISGATPSAYNGTYTIAVVDATHFSYTFAGGSSPATGDITCALNGHGAPLDA